MGGELGLRDNNAPYVSTVMEQALMVQRRDLNHAQEDHRINTMNHQMNATNVSKSMDLAQTALNAIQDHNKELREEKSELQGRVEVIAQEKDSLARQLSEAQRNLITKDRLLSEAQNKLARLEEELASQRSEAQETLMTKDGLLSEAQNKAAAAMTVAPPMAPAMTIAAKETIAVTSDHADRIDNQTKQINDHTKELGELRDMVAQLTQRILVLEAAKANGPGDEDAGNSATLDSDG